MNKTITLLVLATLASSSALAQSRKKVDTLSIQELEEVSVVATRAKTRTPMAYTNIDRKTLQKSNLGQDIPFLLQLQPSVVATSEAGTGLGYTAIRVRGVDATGINITANGVPINDSESQAVFWVNMPDFTSSVQEMQLQRGIGTSSNGAASFGASINMRTDGLSTTPYAEIGLSGGSFNTLRRNIRAGSGLIGGHWSIDARLSKITSNGYVDRATVDLGSYFVQAGYSDDQTIVKLLTFGGKEKTGIAWNGVTQSQIDKFGRTYNSAGHKNIDDKNAKPEYYHNTDNYWQSHYHLVFSHRFSPTTSLNITGHYTKGYGYTDEYRTGRKLVEYGLTPYTNTSGDKIKKVSLVRRKYLNNHFGGFISSFNWRPNRWDISLGASANEYDGDHYGETPWVDYPTALDPKRRYYDGYAIKQEASAYAKASYQITNALSAYADLQYRGVHYAIQGTYDGYNNGMQRIDLSKSFGFFNPKAGLFYQIAPAHSAYASVAISHREPNRKTYTEATPDTYPNPERLTDYELGYSYRTGNLTATVNAYYMKYNDQLVANGKMSDVGGMLLENVPDSYRLGVELTAAYKPVDWLRFDASASVGKSKIYEYTFYYSVYDANWDWTGLKKVVQKDTDIAYSPSTIASGAITLSKWGFEAQLRGQYVGSQYLDNTMNEGRKLPAYHTLGATLSYDIPIKRFIKRWNVSLQVHNLLNTMYSSNAYIYDLGIDSTGAQWQEVRLFPQAGINFLLGTTISI